MPNGQDAQDPRAVMAAQIKQARGDQPPQLPTSPQMSVAMDPTLTSILPAVSPVMPSMAAGAGAIPQQPMDQSLEIDPSRIAMEQVQRSRAKAAQIEPLLTKLQAMGQPQSPTNPEGYPKTGWEPKFEHITGPGSAIKDVLKGLLYGVSLTGPGQSVERGIYAPRERAYVTRRENLTERIKAIQGQQEVEQKPIAPMAEFSYHKELIGTREETNQIRQQLANEKALNDANKTDIERQKLDLARQKAEQAITQWKQRYSMEMRNFQLRAENLDRQTARDQMDEMLRDQANRNFAARTAAGQSEKEAQLATAADISQAKIDADKWLQRTFGMQPKIPPRPNISGGGGGAGAGFSFQVTDPRGVIHTFKDQQSANNFKRAAGIK